MPAPPPGFDPESGEICDGCVARDAEIVALTSEKAGWIAKYQNLIRKLEDEAPSDPLFPVGRAVFDLWRALTGKRRARWTRDRFELIRPFLQNEGEAECKAAVYGLMESTWHVENGRLDFEYVFSGKKDRQQRFERFRDLGMSHDVDPFFVGTEPNLFDVDGGLVKLLRERVLALELSRADKARTARIVAEIHELTEGGSGR
jgi:hypothetical protein